MPANSFSRETARDKLADIITADLPALTVQAVYNYRPRSFLNIGKGPFITIYGGPISRTKSKYGGTYDNKLTLYIQSFVLWIDTTAGWVELNCEDRLDLIEKEVADILLDHRSQAQDATVPWDEILRAGETTADIYKEGERLFWTETIPVIVRKLNG